MPKEAMQRFVDSKRGAHDECDFCDTVLGEKSENTLAKDTLYQFQLVDIWVRLECSSYKLGIDTSSPEMY